MVELALDTFKYVDCETVNVEGKRVYCVPGDNYYPSITTVLGGTVEPEKKKILDNWKARVGSVEAQRVSKAATDRGTDTHLMLERFLRNEDPLVETFPPDHAKMFKSLRLAVKRINKVYGQEVVLYSDILGVAGRCDLIGEYDDELTLIDYKTSGRMKSADEIGDYWLQCVFYATAHNEMFGTNIKKMLILMGVEDHLPMVFKKTINDELLLKLAKRTSEFYDKL
jgi:hypothetical protein